MEIKRNIASIILLVLFILILVQGAHARAPTISTIEPGDTIFVYEEGLDLSYLQPGIIALQKYADDDPVQALLNQIPVMDATNFDLLSSAVAGEYGVYYAFDGVNLPDAGSSVTIREPTLALDAVLSVSHSDSIDGMSVTPATLIAFQVDSPYVGTYYFYQDGMGIAYPAQMRIEVTLPSGAKVVSFGGVSLANLPVDAPRFYTDDPARGAPCSLVGAEEGTYSAQAKWVAPFGFADYAPDSNVVTFTVADRPLNITANKETLIRGNTFATTITGESKCVYYLYVTDASLSSADAYPQIMPAQPGVYLGSAFFPADFDAFLSAAGMEYPQAYWSSMSAWDLFGYFEVDDAFARVATDASGVRTVGWTTTPMTDDRSFTIKVLNPYDSSDYETVAVTVEKGTVTVNGSGNGIYSLGDEIFFSGTNSDSDNVYLFINGPNLPVCGARLDDPQIAAVTSVASTFTVVAVGSGDTWEYRWDTAGVGLAPGNYEVYAVSTPVNAMDLVGGIYDSVPILLKAPTIAAAASGSVAVPGEQFFINGTATGSPAGVAVWLLGPNFALQQTELVPEGGSFSFELSRGMTSYMSEGAYTAIVQHPMMNGVFDIYVFNDPYQGIVFNGVSNTAEFVIWGVGSLSATEAVEALLDLINSPTNDDICTQVVFSIGESWIGIDPIGDYTVGEVVTIAGTTNLPAGTLASIAITGPSGTVSDTVTIAEGAAGNTWSYALDTAMFAAGTYTVTVSSADPAASADSSFALLAAAAPEPCDSISLAAGWNFVSTPKRLAAGNDTAIIFAGVDTAGHSVLLYDAATETWNTMSAVDEVRPLDGIWVYSNASCEIPLLYNTDPMQLPPTKDLAAGWNAIGFSDTLPATAHETLLSVDSSWSTLIGLDADAQAFEPAIINGGTGSHSDLNQMYPGQGYWIFMTGDGMLAAIGS